MATNTEFKRDANWWREECNYLSEQAEPYVRGYGPSEFADRGQFLRYAMMQRDTAAREGRYDAETYIQHIIDDVQE